jgi:hypothetical protein
MPNAASRETNIVNAVNRALGKKADYSNAFTKRVYSFAKLLENELSLRVQHDADMNYSAAQKLIVWLSEGGRPVPPNERDGKFQLITFISSKGPFFAFTVLKLSDGETGWKEKGLTEPRRFWTVLALKDVPKKIAPLEKKISVVIESNNYTLLEERLLSKEAEGHLTELDGKPATVFDVLFSEIQ